jgi:streptomycin 6-kinase
MPGTSAGHDGLSEMMFAPHLSRWHLVPDGEPIVTHSSHLLPVICRGEKAMLKIAVAAEESAAAC